MQKRSIARGEPFSYTIDYRTTGETLTAALRHAKIDTPSRGYVPDMSKIIAANFNVSEIPDAGGGNPGWAVSLTGNQTYILEPGLYLYDDRIEKNGEPIEYTSKGLLEITESITPDAV